MKFRRHNSMLVPAALEPRGPQPARREVFQGVESAVEFGGGEPAFTIENAQKIRGGHVAFKGVAFDAAGNQVAVQTDRGRSRSGVFPAQRAPPIRLVGNMETCHVPAGPPVRESAFFLPRSCPRFPTC